MKFPQVRAPGRTQSRRRTTAKRQEAILPKEEQGEYGAAQQPGTDEYDPMDAPTGAPGMLSEAPPPKKKRKGPTGILKIARLNMLGAK